MVSPKAYVSPSAQIMTGCIIEPMAVIQSMSHLAIGCFVSSGAVVNYASMCCDGVHVEANSTIAASTLVPAGTRVKCGEVFDRKTMDINDFFFNPEEWTKRMNELKKSIEMRTPVPISGQLYNFDDVM